MLEYLSKKHNIRTFSISAENPTGEKGNGAKAEHGIGTGAARDLGKVGWKISPAAVVKQGETYTAADIQGMGAIKHIWFTTDGQDRGLVLRIYFDNQKSPAVEAPLGDFFATAKFNQYKQISSIPVCVNPKSGLNCYWEMPYRKGFKITVENIGEKDIVLFYQFDCEEKEIDEDSLYFHAQFRRTNPLPYKSDYTILDNVKGRGQYVGTYLYWGSHSNGWWGEGEIKFFLDGDKEFPTICGTGSEDYFCASYAFKINDICTEFTSPYSGLSKIDDTDGEDYFVRRFNMYRFHVVDPIYFNSDIKVTIQALGWRRGSRFLPLQDDISSVAYWYSDNLEDEYPPLPDADGLEIN